MSQDLELPNGWTQAIINEAPVALGPWRTFRFGPSLRLTPDSTTWAPTRVSTTGMKEENVETLMLLNLDVLFPGSHMALGGKSLRDWSGADIEATDPAGCRHIFEVKYGAPAKHVVDQALSYALDTVERMAAPLPHFHEQPTEERERFIACRVAGFWTDSRADKWKRDKDKPPAERDWAAMARVLQASEVPGLSVEVCRAAASRFLTDHVAHPVPSRPTHVQFHLAVPDPAKIAEGQLFALGRLKWRGHRARIWQVAAEKAADGSGGRFTLREVWLPPTNTSLASWKVPQDTGPPTLPMDEVLAAVAVADRETFRLLPVGSYSRGECLTLGHSWHGPMPGISIVAESGAVRVEAWVINPKSMAAVHGQTKAAQIKRERCTVISKWLLAAAPPTDDGTVDHVTRMRRKPLSWRCTDATTGLDLEAHHSSGLAVGAVRIEGTDLALLGPSIARCLKQLIEATAPHQAAFGPSAVSL